MAKSPRAALTRVAATITARYFPSSGATDGFYLDGRMTGRREHRAADITLDREDRGFFYAVFAHLSGGSPDEAAQGRVRKALDRIQTEVRQPGRNIDTGINELAECAVAVAGRITLQHDGVRQPYFAGIMVKDSELAAVTMGAGCAYLYRGDVLYPLTSDDFPMEAIDYNGKPVPGLDVYCAGVAGTVRYSNIAQMQPDDCVIVCNKEIMDALGQREILRMLFDAEDQTDAAGMIMTAASAKLPGVPLQFLIGFVESISAADRTGRIPVSRFQPEASAAAPITRTGSGTTAAAAAAGAAGAAAALDKSMAAGEELDEPEDAVPYETEIPAAKSRRSVGQEDSRLAREEILDDEDDYGYESDKSGRGRRIAFYVVIAIICIGCLFAIYNLLFGDRGEPTPTTSPSVTSVTTTNPSSTQTTTSSGSATGTTATSPSGTTGTTGTSQPTGTGQTTKYTVVSGDSLYAIAVKFYGSGAQKYIDLIKTANGLTGDGLQIGQVLDIPPKP